MPWQSPIEVSSFSSETVQQRKIAADFSSILLETPWGPLGGRADMPEETPIA